MNPDDIKLYQEELEDLTGKIYAGDITPLIYDLLKKSPNKEALVKALGGKIEKSTKPAETEQPAFVSFDTLFANGLEVR